VILACTGTLVLTWRRMAPLTVLAISALCFCLYQAVGYRHQDLPFALIVGLYTVSVRKGVVVSAVASAAMVFGAVGADSIRAGVTLDNFDDHLFAYSLALGAACALGYAVQLTQARHELLREQASRLASEHATHEREVLAQEHARIARELHDVVAHQVSVITALAAGAGRVLDTEPGRVHWALNSIEAAGREALTEMRRMLSVLRPNADRALTEPQPGLDRLPDLLARTERAGLPVVLHREGTRPLPAGIDVCAYRIVQEALTNVLKHAGPARAEVSLHYTATDLRLSISDTGRGMAPRPSSGSSGHGLIGMRERAALVGGELTVASGRPSGVVVTARLPIGLAP
jgi:signal transduction histidine kinase